MNVTKQQLVELSKKHLCVLRKEGEEMAICIDFGKIGEEEFEQIFEGCYEELSESELDLLNDCPFHNHWMSEEDINDFIETSEEFVVVTTWEQCVKDDVVWCKDLIEE